MANPLTRTQLTAALKKWFPNGGYEFVTAVGRPGTFAPRGFTVHHTGGPYTDSDSYLKFLFEVGRPDEGIPAQLCQFAIGASGRLYIGDYDSRANHAGMGSSATRTKIYTEKYPGYTSEIEPGPDDINGNPEYYGVEVMYPGTLPMKAAQYKTTVRLAAMIVDTYGWTALSVFAHREHSDRKWDPGQHNLAQLRRDVRALLAAGPGGTVVAISEAEFLRIRKEATIGAQAAINAVVEWQSAGVKAYAESIGSADVNLRRLLEYTWVNGAKAASAPTGDLTALLAAIKTTIQESVAAVVPAEFADDVADELAARLGVNANPTP